jgi:hypothetical protein
LALSAPAIPLALPTIGVPSSPALEKAHALADLFPAALLGLSSVGDSDTADSSGCEMAVGGDDGKAEIDDSASAL